VAYIDIQTAAFAIGASLSAEVALGEKTLAGIVVPNAWNGNMLSFQATPDDVNFYEMYTSLGVELTVAVSAGQFIAMDPTLWRGVTGIKVRSGLLGATVNQTAACALQLITRTIY